MSESTAFKSIQTALITGAGSGIGLALAAKCNSVGINVIMVDKSAENLQRALASDLFTGTGTLKTIQMDVSKLEEWHALKTQLDKESVTVEFLALNAGTVDRSPDWSSATYFHNTLDVNLFGVIYGINTFLPTMQAANKPARIVITGSKQGITNPPGNPAYNASKAAVKSLAEGLSFELRHSPIAVHLLVPGWVYTGLTGATPLAQKPAGAWQPAQCVAYAVEKMAAGTFYIVCPDNEVTEALDQKRMLWGAGDIVYGRPALTRWREDTKDEAASWIEKCEV